MACLVLSLEFIHKNGIIHRDIKPENLVFDEKGYLRLTDFGIARYIKPENSSDTSGTPGYMGKTSRAFLMLSSRGYVQAKSRLRRGLLRSWSDCFRVHDGKSKPQIISFRVQVEGASKLVGKTPKIVETIHW